MGGNPVGLDELFGMDVRHRQQSQQKHHAESLAASRQVCI
jgi:hypothetical protein